MGKFNEIVEGFTNRLLGLEDELSKERFKICNVCDLNTKGFEPFCSSKKWMNVSTGEISDSKLNDDYKNGCGCSLKSKTRSVTSECPLDKWNR